VHNLLRRLTARYRLMTPRARILRRLPPVPEGQTAFRCRNGMIAGYYAGRDHISASLYWFGDFEPWVDATLRRLAQPGDVALDIGANIGCTSLVLAHAVGPRGKVIAIEPHPGNARLLRCNLSANSLSTVEVQEVAMSDSEGSLSLKEPPGQPGMSSLCSEAGGGSMVVPTHRLDQWLEGRPELGAIAVCKIDVEGHEPSVFAGMPTTLAAGRIASFVLERHLPAPAPDDPVLNLLADYGYEVYRIEKSPLKARYVDPKRPPEARPTSDYVAVHTRSNVRSRLGLRSEHQVAGV
jgi:FkbM family methyltransferase